MKYVVLAIISAFSGFVASWLLFQAVTATTPVTPKRVGTTVATPTRTPYLTQTPQAAAARPTFDDIDGQASVFDKLHLAWQVAAGADAPELEALVSRCLDSDDPLYTMSIASILVERYTAIDPRAAMDFVSREYRFDQAFIQGHVLTSWVRDDPRGAVDYFKSIDDPQIRTSVGMRLLEDPTLANTGMQQEIKDALGPFSEQIVERIRINQMDPVELFDQALQMNGTDRRTRLSNAVNRWAARDPEAVLLRIGSLADPNERQIMLQVAIQQYAMRDPLAALEYLEAHEPGNVELRVQVLGFMASRDVERALPLAEDLMRRTGNTRALSTILARMVQTDPERAITYVESLDNTNRDLFRNVAFNYVNSHPEQGFAWILGLGPEYRDIQRMVLSSIDQNTIFAAEQALRTTTDPDSRSVLFQGIARYKAELDPDSALDWLAAYRRDAAYPSAYQRVIQSLANRDPARAADLLDTTVEANELSGTVLAIADAWYRVDADRAVDWVTSLPDSQARNNAIINLTGRIARRDVDQALALVRILPANMRGNATYQIAYAWNAREPGHVEEIVSRLDLPDEIADQLRRGGTVRY